MQVQNSVNNIAANLQVANQSGIAKKAQSPTAESRAEKSERIESPKNADSILVSTERIALLDQERQKNQSALYDQPPGKNRLAIQAYVGVNTIEKRDSVQQMLGVDLFA